MGAGSFCRAARLTFNLPLPAALGAGVSLNCPSMCPALHEGSNLNLQPAAALPTGFWGCVLTVLWGKVGRGKALCSLIRTHKAKTTLHHMSYSQSCYCNMLRGHCSQSFPPHSQALLRHVAGQAFCCGRMPRDQC